jgi:hypothetical protein
VTVVHKGPENELGDRMTIDDLHYLSAWFKQITYRLGQRGLQGDYPEGLKIAEHGWLSYVLMQNVIDTQDLCPIKGHRSIERTGSRNPCDRQL